MTTRFQTVPLFTTIPMRRNPAHIGCFLLLFGFPGPCTTFDDVNPKKDASGNMNINDGNGRDAATDPERRDGATGSVRDGEADSAAGSVQDAAADGAADTVQDAAADGAAGSVQDAAADGSPNGAQDDTRLLREAAVVCTRAFTCPGLQEAVLASVGFPLSHNNYALCLHWASDPFGVHPHAYHQAQIDMLDCIASAADCEQALACTFVRPLHIDDALCEGQAEEPRCDASGNAVVECPGRWRRCDSPLYSNDARCAEGVDMLGVPVARCVVDEPCTAGLGTGYCTDDWAVNCDMDLRLTSVTDCAVTGRTCIAQATGAACISAVGDLQCVFTAFPGTYAAEVLRAGSAACVPDGNAVAVCDGEQFATFDCSAVDGHQCRDQDFPPWAWCAPADATCSPGSIGGEAAVCDGDRVTVCVRGRTVIVDCAQLDMHCERGTAIRSAHCAP